MKRGLLMWGCLLSVLLPTLQAIAEEMVELRIETVLATDVVEKLDDRLTGMRKQLDAFRYSSYRLVQEERRRVSYGKEANFLLPGGRLLQVVPKQHTNDKISLQVMLMEGATPTPLMNTSLLIPNHGMFFVGGPKHAAGALIIRIGAAVSEE